MMECAPAVPATVHISVIFNLYASILGVKWFFVASSQVKWLLRWIWHIRHLWNMTNLEWEDVLFDNLWRSLNGWFIQSLLLKRWYLTIWLEANTWTWPKYSMIPLVDPRVFLLSMSVHSIIPYMWITSWFHLTVIKVRQPSVCLVCQGDAYVGYGIILLMIWNTSHRAGTTKCADWM